MKIIKFQISAVPYFSSDKFLGGFNPKLQLLFAQQKYIFIICQKLSNVLVKEYKNSSAKFLSLLPAAIVKTDDGPLILEAVLGIEDAARVAHGPAEGTLGSAPLLPPPLQLPSYTNI